MFHVTAEQTLIHNGFNFYPLSDVSSFGFRFRYGKMSTNKLGFNLFIFRYSKRTKKWIISFIDISD